MEQAPRCCDVVEQASRLLGGRAAPPHPCEARGDRASGSSHNPQQAPRCCASALGVIARSAPPKAVRDEAIGPLNPSHGIIFERSRLAFPETLWTAVTDCHVATCGRSSQ